MKLNLNEWYRISMPMIEDHFLRVIFDNMLLYLGFHIICQMNIILDNC